MKRIMSKKEMIEKIKKKLTGSKETSREDLQIRLQEMHDNNEFHLKWKVFEQNELYNAEYYAFCGGIALHKMNMNADEFFNDKTSAQTVRAFKGREFAHLFGPSVAHLTQQAVKIGCKPQWVQKTNPPHFDVTGSILARALAKCLKGENGTK